MQGTGAETRARRQRGLRRDFNRIEVREYYGFALLALTRWDSFHVPALAPVGLPERGKQGCGRYGQAAMADDLQSVEEVRKREPAALRWPAPPGR